jgi:hypothetical protein
MSAEQSSIASVTDRVRAVEIGAPVTSAYFLKERAAFVCGEEKVALVSQQGEISNVCGLRRRAHRHGRR